MGSFGERLQREREMRGISLEEIATATKIGTRCLRALEEEDFGKLPGGIFNKGFVRAYARYLGIDAEQAVADYLVAVGDADQLSDEATMRRLEPALKAEKERLAAANDGSTSRSWTPILVIVLLAVLTAFGWNFYSKHKLNLRALVRPAAAQSNTAVVVPTPPAVVPAAPPVTPAPSAVVPASAADPAPQSAPPAVATAAAPAASTSKTTTSAELVVVVRARQKSWLSASADGKPVMKDTLQPGGETSIRAKQQVVLTAGNAGGVDVLLNGKPLPPLGPEDQKKTVIITAAGMRPAPPKPQPAQTEN